MKIGIVGANGFVGRHLCSKFLKQGCTVYAIVHNTSSNIPAGCVVSPIGNLSKVKFDYLFIAIGNHSQTIEQYTKQLIVLQSIIKLKYKKIIYVSSTAVYGRHNDIINVNSSYNNSSLYGYSKLAEELLIKSTGKYSIIRPTYIYGPGMNVNSLLPNWINAANKHKKITVLGNGSRIQDYIFIDDLIDLCDIVAKNDNDNSTILAATGISISNHDLAILISKFYSDVNIQLFDTDNTPSFEYDITNQFNWIPKYSIHDGLKIMINANSNI